MVKVFKNNLEIGGYTIPADFKCLNLDFLNSLLELDFFDRVKAVYKHFTGEELTSSAFLNLNNAEFPATVNVLPNELDLNILAVELNDGNNYSYEDYVFNKNNPLTEFYSFLTLITVSYLNIVDAGVIELGEKIKIALPSFEGYFCLAAYVLSKIGLPILTVSIGGENFQKDKFNNINLYNTSTDVIEDYLYYFFLNNDYVLDLKSSACLIPADDLVYEKEELFTVIFAFISPYFDAVKIYNTIANAHEISPSKAINKLYEETAFEIPEDIISGKIKPNYTYRFTVEFENLIKFL